MRLPMVQVDLIGQLGSRNHPSHTTIGEWAYAAKTQDHHQPCPGLGHCGDRGERAIESAKLI
jgi:hypothetical protein